MFKSNFKWLLGVYALLALLFVYTGVGLIMGSGDNWFLYNRAYNIADCWADGNWAWYYYQDLNTLGYGSSFFYPDLTLYPMALMISLWVDSLTCIKFYKITCLILFLFGACSLCKRFTRNYVEIASLFILSPFVLTCYIFISLPAQDLGVGLTLFFWAKCLDFFRDRQKFYPASLLFFLLINTHLLSTFLGFIGCVLIFILYFDKSRINDYFKFAAITGLLCIYVICNIVYHKDFTMVLDSDVMYYNEAMEVWFLDTRVAGSLIIPAFSGYLTSGTGICEAITLIVITGLLVRRVQKKAVSKRELLVFIIVLIMICFSFKESFVWLSSTLRIPLHFSIRWMGYLTLALLGIGFRNCKSKIVYFIAYFSSLIFVIGYTLFACNITPSDFDERTVRSGCPIDSVTLTGEYLKSNIVLSFDDIFNLPGTVMDNYGNTYQISYIEDKLVVDIPKDGLSRKLRFPKLYYKGFKCYNSEEEFNIYMNDSQCIVAELGINGGEVTLQYQHPLWLKVMYFAELIFFGSILGYWLVYKFKKQSKNLTNKDDAFKTTETTNCKDATLVEAL